MKKITMGLMFVGGLLLGTLVTFIIAGKTNQRLWARCVATGVMEQAFIATELRTQRQDDLQQRAEANLVPAVLALHQHKELQSVPESQNALLPGKRWPSLHSSLHWDWELHDMTF